MNYVKIEGNKFSNLSGDYGMFVPVEEFPKRSVYLIGSLRNPLIPELGNKLRAKGVEVFDDWFAAGPEADDYWQKYEKGKGNTYAQALAGYAVDNVFSFDRLHLNRVTDVCLVMPAGKSGHLELGYAAGIGKRTSILFDKEPERWDAMYKFADKVYFSWDDFLHDY